MGKARLSLAIAVAFITFALLPVVIGLGRTVIPLYGKSVLMQLLLDHRFLSALKNAMFVSALSSVLSVGFAVCVLFLFRTMSSSVRDAAVVVMTFIAVMPAVAAIPAIFYIARALGLIDSLFGVALIQAANFGSVLWILKERWGELNREPFEAAIVDGWSKAQAFLKVELAQMKRTLAIAFGFSFIQSWNAFLIPFFLLSSPNKFTLSVYVAQLIGEQAFEPEFALGAGILASVIPVIVWLGLLSRYNWRAE